MCIYIHKFVWICDNKSLKVNEESDEEEEKAKIQIVTLDLLDMLEKDEVEIKGSASYIDGHFMPREACDPCE